MLVPEFEECLVGVRGGSLGVYWSEGLSGRAVSSTGRKRHIGEKRIGSRSKIQ